MLEQEETYIDYLLVLLIAIGLAFVIVSFQLKSLAYSLMIFSIIPFTLIGGILGLFITNNELNALSAIGFIILVGIVLNNSILLIDRLNYYKGWRISINERILKSVGDRWKPIILTTATTILGMLPLALASGNSSNYQSPLAVVVIFGLVFSTFITLLLVPSLYNLIERFRDRKVRKSS